MNLLKLVILRNFELRLNFKSNKNYLVHKKSTILSEVGLQIWRGAFLLNDFILCNQQLFSHKNVLEVSFYLKILNLI